MDFSTEIRLQTTRSGGKGGQNVNKVETAVIASFGVRSSQVLTEAQKAAVLEKLANRINGEGLLIVRAQTHRTQLANREEAIGRIHALVAGALRRKKARIATKPSRASGERRLEGKKRSGEVKVGRKKFRPDDF